MVSLPAGNVQERIVFGCWILREILGEGSYGTVYAAVNQETQERIAIKVLPKSSVAVEAVTKEFLIHKAACAENENILQVFWKEEDEANSYLGMEYAVGGELFERIEPDQGFPSEDLIHALFLQLLRAVEQMHKKGIAHRDLKPENILLDADGAIKIADFGLSTIFLYRGERRLINVKCGSEIYMAPQVYENPVSYEGDKSDCWSIGMILYVMLFGSLPWECPDPVKSLEYQNFLNYGGLSIWSKHQKPFSTEPVLGLLERLLCVDERLRYSCKEIKSHPWYQRVNPLIKIEKSDFVVNKVGLCSLLLQSGCVEGPPSVLMSQEMSCGEDLIPLSQPSDCMFGMTVAESSAFDDGEISRRSAALVYSQQPQTQGITLMTDSPTKPVHPLDEGTMRLTRFYTAIPIDQAIQILSRVLDEFLIQKRLIGSTAMAFQTVDKRKCLLTGEIAIAATVLGKNVVIFKKNRGESIEFKRLFYAVFDAYNAHLQKTSNKMA